MYEARVFVVNGTYVLMHIITFLNLYICFIISNIMTYILLFWEDQQQNIISETTLLLEYLRF